MKLHGFINIRKYKLILAVKQHYERAVLGTLKADSSGATVLGSLRVNKRILERDWEKIKEEQRK